jgi:putative membrane protein
MWHPHEGMGWWMVMGWVWFFIFWGAIIYLFFWAVGRLGSERRSEDTPLEILKRRYARGEISKEQYEEMRRDLG